METLNNLGQILDMVDVLKAMPGTKDQRASLLRLFDEYYERIDSRLADTSSAFRMHISPQYFVHASKYGFLFHFPPQSLIYDPAFEAHADCQWCWISASICRKQRGVFEVCFYPQSYFRFFNSENPDRAVQVDADGMVCVLTSAENELRLMDVQQPRISFSEERK